MGVLSLDDVKNAMNMADSGSFEYETSEKLENLLAEIKSQIGNSQKGILESVLSHFLRSIVTDQTLINDIMKLAQDFFTKQKTQ